MNKETIKAKLFEVQNSIVKELEEKIATSHSMVDVDEDDTLDPEDFSHQYESGELESLMKVQLLNAKMDLSRLNKMDFSSKDSVTDGALVQTNKFNFIIGFSTVPFDIENDHIIGISHGSPIFSSMENKKQGDEFSFHGINYKIENIY